MNIFKHFTILLVLVILASCSKKGSGSSSVVTAPGSAPAEELAGQLKTEPQSLVIGNKHITPATGIDLDLIESNGAKHECLNCPDGLVVDPETGRITGDLPNGFDDEIEVKISKGNKNNVVNIPLKQVNETAPGAIDYADQTVEIYPESPSLKNVNLTTADTSKLVFSLEGTPPSYVTINSVTGKISFNPPAGLIQNSHSIQIRAENGAGFVVKTINLVVASRPTLVEPTNTYYANQFCADVTNPNTGSVRLEITSPSSLNGNNVTDSGNSCVDISSISDASNIVIQYKASGSGVSSELKSITITKDTAPPTLSAKTILPLTFVNTDQTSSFTFVDAVSGMAPLAPLTCAISTEGANQTCDIDASSICDYAGNCMSGNITSFDVNLDKTAPVFSSKNTFTAGWKNSNQTSVFSFTDSLSGVDTPSPECVISSEGSSQSCSVNNVNVCDLAGNCLSYSGVSNLVDIDKTAPAFDNKSITSLGGLTNGYYKQNQTATFNFTDAVSGVDGSSSRTCIVSTEGAAVTCSISESLCDLAGNCNTQNLTSDAIALDKTAPTLSTKTAIDNNWVNTDKIQTFTFSDSLSGVDGSSSRTCAVSTEGAAVTCSVSSGSVCDLAGNCLNSATESHPVKLDKTNPVFSSKTIFADGWHNSNKTSVFTFTDSLSGVASSNPQCDITAEGSLQTCSVSAVNVCDNAGNCLSYSGTSNTADIDKTPPVFSNKTVSSTGGLSNGYYKQNQTATFNFSDTVSGVSGSSSRTCNIESEGVNVSCDSSPIVCDNAGNCDNFILTSDTISIDKTAPYLATAPNSSSNWFNSDQVQEFTFADNISGVNGGEIRNCTVSTEGTDSRCSIASGSVCDRAGNCLNSITYSPEVKLDKTSPTLGTLAFDRNLSNGIVVRDTVATLSPTDSLSGVDSGATLQCTFNESSTSSSDFKECNLNVCDNAGNCADSNNQYIVKHYALAPLVNEFGLTGNSGIDDSLIQNTANWKSVVKFKGNIYLSSHYEDGTNPGKRLFKYNGTSFTRVGEYLEASEPVDVQHMISTSTHLYFIALIPGSSYYRMFYTTDGSTIETLGAGEATDPGVPTIHEGSLYFSASNTSGANKLYKFDGTNLTLPLGVGGIRGSSATDNINGIVSYGGSLYFSAKTPSNYQKLYKWDGTNLTQPLGANGTSGSATMDDFRNTPASYYGLTTFPEFAVYGSNLYFKALNGAGGNVLKMFRWNGTALTQPFGVNGISGTNSITDAIFYLDPQADGIYFAAQGSSMVRKLYRYNGTTLSILGGNNGAEGSGNSDNIVPGAMFNGKYIIAAYKPDGTVSYQKHLSYYLGGWEYTFGPSGISGNINTTDYLDSSIVNIDDELYFAAQGTFSVARLHKYGLVFGN